MMRLWSSGHQTNVPVGWQWRTGLLTRIQHSSFQHPRRRFHLALSITTCINSIFAILEKPFLYFTDTDRMWHYLVPQRIWWWTILGDFYLNDPNKVDFQLQERDDGDFNLMSSPKCTGSNCPFTSSVPILYQFSSANSTYFIVVVRRESGSWRKSTTLHLWVSIH